MNERKRLQHGLFLALVVVCSASPIMAQFYIAFHPNAETAAAMAPDQEPMRQGTVVDTSASAWLNLVGGGTIEPTQLLNQDGTPSGAKISGQVWRSGASVSEWADKDKDHVLMSGGFNIRGSEFLQVDNLPADFQGDFSVRIFAAGGGVQFYSINEVGDTIVSCGPFTGPFFEDRNQVTFTGLTGRSFRVTGPPAVQGRSVPHAPIMGMQIFKGLPPVVPDVISGSESPAVHSPGGTIEVHVDFKHEVSLSKEGGAKLRLDFDGRQVDAVHTGVVKGKVLTFEAKAPAVTTMNGNVLANSLALDAGVTLKDRTLKDVRLGHREVPLRNDQISTRALSVYPPVPGLEPSPHYRFRVRKLDSREWLSPFAFMTKCGTGGGYYAGGVGGWTHTYINIEMARNVPVEVEITRLNPITGAPVAIRSAVTHPRHRARSWRVENGKAYVIFENPALLTVDIDGQMDDNPVPRNPPKGHMTNEDGMHTVSIFANPFILDKPDLEDPTVFAVEPGTVPPQDGDWKTLYFKPGVHQVWEGTWKEDSVFYVKDGKTYYIPGDAIVHGTIRGGGSLRIFGHGTLTQERITHALHQTPRLRNRGLTSGMRIGGAVGTRIEGIAITDSPDHSLWLNGPFNADPDTWNYIRWVKVVTWRGNGDGITVDDNDFLEDSFIRTQDDGTYLKGRGVRRMVYWVDCNGTALKINMISRMNPDHYLKDKFYVEDIDILYGRSHWPGSMGHNVLGGRADFRLLRGRANNLNDSSHIVFRNINFSDPMPLRKMFGYSTGRGGEKEHVGVRFENIRATENSLYGYRASMWGIPNGPLRDFVLSNVVLAGRQVKSRDDMEFNEHVVNVMFENTDPEVRRFRNHSGYNKWYMRKDWCGEVEPADHDIVKHTEQAGGLIVDCPAWAGTLDVAHSGKAVIRLEYSGRLSVSDTLTLGDAKGARGEIHLTEGELVLRKDADDALAVPNGSIHFEGNGVLLWAGDRVEAVRALMASGKITLGEGRTSVPQMRPYDRVWALLHRTDIPDRPAVPVLVGEVEGRALYADFNNIYDGFTTVWVLKTR
jgi:hypothetical protein